METSKIVELLTNAKTAIEAALIEVGGDAETFPTAEQISEMALPELKKLASAFGIATKLKQAELVTVLSTVAHIAADEKDSLELAAVQLTQKALGIEPAKKLAKGIESIASYIEASKAEETEETDETETDDADADSDEEGTDDDSDAEEKEEADEDDEEEGDDESEDEDEDAEGDADDESGEDAEDSEDEDSDEDGGDDEEASDDDSEGDDEGEDGDDESEDEDAEGDEDSDEEEEESEDEAEEVDAATQKKRLDAFNKVAKKKLKKYTDLEAALTDDEGNVAEWGAAYVKNEEGYCCGMPIEETKIKGEKRQTGKCAVTGKAFVVNKKGQFVPLK